MTSAHCVGIRYRVIPKCMGLHRMHWHNYETEGQLAAVATCCSAA